ncbi:hypothetical protein WJX84_011315 [Apatococcus fuscideae]|uniref:Uncharacterized protein n=1 Tax=Apatococcus fuscideae TaxID=2026836 RepID=A0AAW1TDT8_9CHLO
MPVTDEEVVTKLRQLLADVDMETTTERKLRTALESHFKEELTAKKQVISEEVKRYLAEAEAQADDGGEEAAEPESAEGSGSDEPSAKRGRKGSKAEAPVKKKRKASTSGGNPLSPELSAFLGGVKVMQRTEVVKRLWEYIKSNELQDPGNKQSILPDEKMLTLFSAPLTMFTMNKQLSRHILPKDPNAPPPAPRAKKPKTVGEDGVEKPANGFQKPVKVSAELASWLGGVTEISWPQLTAAFWKYVKENGLQDPANRKNILADAKLKELTGESQFMGFGFMKLFAPHIIKD